MLKFIQNQTTKQINQKYCNLYYTIIFISLTTIIFFFYLSYFFCLIYIKKFPQPVINITDTIITKIHLFINKNSYKTFINNSNAFISASLPVNSFIISFKELDVLSISLFISAKESEYFSFKFDNFVM